jgi:hypothetical protein
LLRSLKERKQHYKICVTTSSWKMKTDFEMIANGL